MLAFHEHLMPNQSKLDKTDLIECKHAHLYLNSNIINEKKENIQNEINPTKKIIKNRQNIDIDKPSKHILTPN